MCHYQRVLYGEFALLPHILLAPDNKYNTYCFLFARVMQTVNNNTLGPVALNMVSANNWLRSIEAYKFRWQLTFVSANHTSSNLGLAFSTQQNVTVVPVKTNQNIPSLTQKNGQYNYAVHGNIYRALSSILYYYTSDSL